MRWAVNFGLRSLVSQWKLVLVLSLVFGVAAAGYLTLVALQEGLDEIFTPAAHGWLVVQEPGLYGEVDGSVLSAESALTLQRLGASRVIPAVHVITGTNRQDMRLVHGVTLEAYTETNPFRLLEGRALQPGDTARTAMLGWRLAWRWISTGCTRPTWKKGAAGRQYRKPTASWCREGLAAEGSRAK